MTVTYTAEVSTSSFGCFLKLLLRWRGSIYKLVWKEFLIFLAGFYTLNFVYRFALKEDQKRIFEMVARYCEQYNNLIPVAFVLGFYVSIVVTRWWDQFTFIPWPDRMALFVTANIQGHDDRMRLMRRTLMRYLCLAYVITMSSISPVVKKRFPTFQHMTDAGLMNPNEEQIIDDINTPHNKYFVPLVWATTLVTRGRKEGKIRDDFAVKTLIDTIIYILTEKVGFIAYQEINNFRGQLGGLFNYDWISVPLVYTQEINSFRGQLGGLFAYDCISIPLVYTQVVTLAVYTFFLSTMMGRQFVADSETADVYVPVFTFLQFFFYMGWLKVAESLVNPFGEDDDDFDINTVIDRNLQVAYLVVDEMHQETPELIRDQYWDETYFELPYTEAALPHKDPIHLGSAMHINTPRDAEFVATLGSIAEEPGEGLDIRMAHGSHGSQGLNRSFFREKKFLNRLLRREDSRNSVKRTSQRQMSTESGTTIPETPISQHHQMMNHGGNHLKSEENIFEMSMSDLGSVVGGPSRTGQMISQTSLSRDQSDGPDTSRHRLGKVTARVVDENAKTSTSAETSPVTEARTPVTVVGSDSSLITTSKA